MEGQALVLYRVEGADASSRARGLAANADDAAPLAQAGVSVEQTWDFSAVDQAVASASHARSANALDASAADEAAQATPAGTDLRIALVSDGSVGTDELIARLAELDCVEAV